MSSSLAPLTRPDSARYRALLEITNAVITSLEKDELLRSTFTALDKHIPFDMAGIALLEPGIDALRFFAIEGDVARSSYPLGSSIDRHDSCFGHAAATLKPVLRFDLEEERVFATDERLREQGMRSYCTVPLMVRRRSEGALSLVSRSARRYTPADCDFLQEVANQLALAVANMRAYEQIAALQKELESENRELREEVLQAAFQVLQAENAASMGRFAAVLAHELNSPIAALKSSVESTVSLAKRRAARPERHTELAAIEADLAGTMLESARRLQEIVERMQRFTNLDRSEMLQIDLNELLEDAVELLRPKIPANVQLDFVPEMLPPIRVRPQQLSAVFFGLLQKAVDAPAGERRRIVLSTHRMADEIRALVHIDGLDLPADELAYVFDPAFESRDGRIAASNWELFSARQVVREHGGNVDVTSDPGKGTLLRVRLPIAAARARAI